MIKAFFRLPVIIGALPVTLLNGTIADATQVMSDLNWIVNQVNANAAALATTAVTNANNNFTAVQSGLAATAPANFPIASQVQSEVFNTLSSTVGSNTITGRIAAFALNAYAVGQVFRWFSNQRNGGAATLAIDGLAAGAIQSGGAALLGNELGSSMTEVVVRDLTPTFELMTPQPAWKNSLILGKGDFLAGKAALILGRVAAGPDGAVPGWFSSEAVGMKSMFLGSGVQVGPGNSIALLYAASSTQITGTSSQLPVAPSVQQQHDSAAKAWGLITPATTVSASYPSSGVSVVRNSAGNFTVTHGRTMKGTAYAVIVTFESASPGPGIGLIAVNTRSTTAFGLLITDTSGTGVDPVTFSYCVYGQLAIPT